MLGKNFTDQTMYSNNFSRKTQIVKSIIDYICKSIFNIIKFPERLIRHYLKGDDTFGIGWIQSTRARYAIWRRNNEPRTVDLQNQRTQIFLRMPKISILVPLHQASIKFLEEMVESVTAQTYSNWELCLANGGSRETPLWTALKKLAASDPRIKIVSLVEDLGIARNTNLAADLATGEFIALLDQDDTLAPFALYAVVDSINKDSNADVLYSDEDKIDVDGKIRSSAFFKPDFSPDTLRSQNYLCHLVVINKVLFERIGRFRDGFDGYMDYDIILRVIEKTNHIVHIPKILYHRRMDAGSIVQDASAQNCCSKAAKKALVEHLQRLGLKGKVVDGLYPDTYQIMYEIENESLVSIVIPNKDNPLELKKCVYSILSKTTWKAFEIIIIENNSENSTIFSLYDTLQQDPRIRVIKWAKSFNYSSINNFAVESALGEYVLLLNNDTEIISPDWIERMLEHAQRPGIGLVGAMLYYPDDTVQHAGVIIGLHGLADHSHRGRPRNTPGYFNRMGLVQNLSAVTFACVLMRKSIYQEIGGLDDAYAVTLNDVDFCMKAREKGYLIVLTPYAELYHFESKTRGAENTPQKKLRSSQEIAMFRQRWGTPPELLDPYYNPNFSLWNAKFEIRTR